MRPFRLARWLPAVALPALLTASFNATPEDIDIYSVDEGSNLNAPNVLIVLDNTSNWSRQAQQWPGGETQGQSEVAAIKEVIATLNTSVNVGLMEYITGGAAGDTDSGYIRAHIRPMNPTNKTFLSNAMDKIYADINAPEEKRSSSNPYGTLFYDVYNYLAGADHSNSGNGTPTNLVDNAGYDVNYSNFRTPLTSGDTCTRTIVIFIGNNGQGTITADSAANVSALRALAGGGTAGDAAVAQIPHADYEVTTQNVMEPLGYSSACFSTAAACTSAIPAATCTEQGYASCSCDATDVQSCPSAHWRVIGTRTNTVTTPISDNTVTTTNQPTNELTRCAKSNEPPPAADCTLPPDSNPVVQNNTPAPGQTTTTTTTWTAGSCSWYFTDVKGSCTGANRIWERRGTKNVRTRVTSSTTTTSQDDLGDTNACYNDAVTCNPSDVVGGCPSATYTGGCQCVATSSTTGCAAGNTRKYQIQGNYTVVAAEQTGTFSAAPAGPLMMDEWARFMRQTGVTVPGLSAKNQVTTYAIDVFNAQQNTDLSGLWFNAARVGGGKYFQAKDKQSIVTALKQIFTEVQAVNSAFSSASLPISATNRSQNENQIFIGVFKPDRTKDPLWFGNLKRFQAIRVGADIGLGDQDGNLALNNQTGFFNECATSFWTVDSGTYWQNVITDDPDAVGICATNTTSDLSDAPDGPFVEKGGAAQVMRNGNGGASAAALNRRVKTVSGGALVDFTNAVFDDGDASTDDADEQSTVDFIRGADIKDEDLDTNRAEARSTVHGDVVHSRPLPVNYGGTTGVVVYYGANDGLLRAVTGGDEDGTGGGEELWSFAAPEHFSKFRRLRTSGEAGNSLVRYFGDTLPGASPKDYFFDGSTGLYQVFNDSNVSTKALIFPTMRRGGRKVYAFDVTNPSVPSFLWSRGCPNATNDTGCDTGFEAIGQTWSLASVATLKGYFDGTRPVVIFGGGYDRCEDNDFRDPCNGTASKGRGVYVVDAQSGALVKHFDFSANGYARGIAADIALVSTNPDKFVDYAYAADTGGNIYRMDFVDGPATLNALAPAAWVASRVAYTNGGGRKFLFPPALVQKDNRTVFLAIGSGDREHPLMGNYPFGVSGFPNTAVENRFYIFKDDVGETDSTTVLNLDSEAAPNYMDDVTGGNCTNAVTGQLDPLTAGSQKRGLFKKLTDDGQGEQVVTSAIIATGKVNFSTNRPTPPSALECSSSLGEAKGYTIDLDCGDSSSAIFVGGGLPPSPVIATIQIGDRVETVVIGVADPEGGESSALDVQLRNPNLDSKRRPVYWYKSTGEN